MKGLRLFDRRVGFSLGALSVLMGMMVPAVLPAFASAAQITARSIQMSSSTVSATNVNYQLTFTPATSIASAGGYVVLWFCSDSPLSGASCAAPSGMSLSSASLTNRPGTEAILTSGSDTYVGAGANYLVFKNATFTGGSSYQINVAGVTNPSTAGTFYGRIETFNSAADAKAAGGDTAHTGTANGSVVTNMVDNGSVALAATNEIGVSAAVLESMTFCTYGDPGNSTSNGTVVGTNNSSGYLTGLANGNNGPKGDCTNGNSNTGTAITIGQQQSTGVLSLDTTHVSYGYGWTGLSTNASGGAIVYLKNNSSCAGLALNGGATCQIPALNAAGGTTSLAAGTAAYGLTFGGGSTPGSFASPSPGTQTGSIELNNHYKSNWALLGSGAGVSSGQSSSENGLTQDVTSTYGGFVYGTAGSPATAQDVPFGIGAAISANTPAGKYSNNLSLIAVGTF